MATKSHTQTFDQTQILPPADIRAIREARMLASIVAEYGPYDDFPAFYEGFDSHARRVYVNPYAPSTRHVPTAQDGVNAQAWDRGLDAAARYARALAGLDKPLPQAIPLPVSARPSPEAARDSETILAEIAAGVEASARD